MEKREILCTPYGEMVDMISCMAIYNGTARQKKKKKKWKFEDAIALR